MKKGLLTVLLASLVLVGCQNYDDQFDDLNAQISALKSQVDGLSALSGQVSSLSGTISGLQSGISAAQASAASAAASADAIDLSGLSTSLATLQAEVDAIEAAIATTATAAEVAALQTSLTAVETDLADLLVSNNVYSTAIAVTDAASMASALALGNKVALMNSSVTITDNAAISDTDIQTFVDKIATMNGTFSYSSGSATGFTPTFDKMVAGKDMIITAAGDISFKALASATTIEIHDDYETKITSVDFGALTSVTSFTTDEGGTDDANALELDSATNIDLGSLARYGSALDIRMKKGGTLDISSLDDVNATGTQADIALTITGPDSVTLSKIDDGTITLTDVSTATVHDFYGNLVIGSGVTTLTTKKSVFVDLDSASDLETATLDFTNDYDPLLTTATAKLSAAGNSSTYTESYSGASGTGSIAAASLKTLTVTGNLLDLYLDEANLESVTVNASMDDLTISGTTDLTSVSVPSTAKMNDVTVTGATNLSSLTLSNANNFTAHGTTAQTSVSYSITNNTAMTSLTTNVDDIGSLTVTGNTSLETVNFANLKDFGAATEPAVNIYGNKLTASSATDSTDGDTNVADGKAGNLGTYDSGTSGMNTLKTYLTAVAAEGDSDAYVSFDTVSTFTNSEGTTDSVTLNVSYVNTTTFNAATVLRDVESVVTAGKSASYAKRSFLLDISRIKAIQLYAGGSAIIDIDGDGAAAKYVPTGNTAAQVLNALNDADNVARAAANGVTYSAVAGGNSTAVVHIGTELDSALWETSAAAVSGISLTASDIITFSVGNLTVTTSVTTNQGSAFGKVQAVTDAIQAVYNAKNTAASEILYDFDRTHVEASSAISNAKGQQLTFTARDFGTGGSGLSISLTAASVDGTTIPQLPVAYGATNASTDNVSAGPDLVVTFVDTVAGASNNTIGLPATSAASSSFTLATVSHVGDTNAGVPTAITELHSNYKPNAGTGKATSEDQHSDEAWSDVTYPEGVVDAVTTTAAVDSSHVHWLD